MPVLTTQKHIRAISMVAVCLFAQAATLSSTHAADENRALGERSVFSERAIRERIAPVGSVCLEGQDDCATLAATDNASSAETTLAANEALTPEGIYESKCKLCHSVGMANAPKPGSEDWQARLKEKGIEQLLKNAIIGINAMPPRGMCGECSDDNIKDTIEFMINKKS